MVTDLFANAYNSFTLCLLVKSGQHVLIKPKTSVELREFIKWFNTVRFKRILMCKLRKIYSQIEDS